MRRENISDAIDMLDEELLGTVAEMRGQKKARKFSVSKLVGIAAAALLVISATLLTISATYRFVVDPNDVPRLLGTALTYAKQSVRLEEDGMKEIHFIDYCWDDYRYDQSVEGKLTGLRPVYNVKFKVAGYVYDIDIDIKTEVVTRCGKTVDADWDTHFDDYENFEKLHTNWMIMVGDLEPEVEAGEMTYTMAYTALEDYFGLDTGNHRCATWPTDKYKVCSNDYSTDPMTIQLSYYHSGYIYECRVNSVTAEVTDINVREALYEETIHPYTFMPDDTPKHLHVHSDDSEYIGRYAANLIAIEELGFPKANDNYWDDRIVLHEERMRYNPETKKDEWMPDGVDAVYHYYVKPDPWIEPDQSKPGANVFINAKTGEIIKVEYTDRYRSVTHRELHIPSADAPEGMISEADVQVIIIEDLELKTHDDLYGFSIELKDGVYEVLTGSRTNKYGVGGSVEYNYKVDAVTGEIISKEQVGG